MRWTGPSRSKLSIFRQTLFAIGNSTSNRRSGAFIQPPATLLQSSRTRPRRRRLPLIHLNEGFGFNDSRSRAHNWQPFKSPANGKRFPTSTVGAFRRSGTAFPCDVWKPNCSGGVWRFYEIRNCVLAWRAWYFDRRMVPLKPSSMLAVIIIAERGLPELLRLLKSVHRAVRLGVAGRPRREKRLGRTS